MAIGVRVAMVQHRKRIGRKRGLGTCVGYRFSTPAIAFLARLIAPFFSRIFPEVPRDHPATGLW